jgi:hypothetical protein
MYRSLIGDIHFQARLLEFDRDLQAQARERRCPCGGALHRGDYQRKPRGLCRDLGPEHSRRFSLACAVDGCRKRSLPASFRFLGPKVYVATLVILLTVLQQGPTAARLQRLAAETGVDRRTLLRWRRWWLETFQESRFWQAARAAFMPPADPGLIPLCLLDRFDGSPEARLLSLLRFLLPITGGGVQPASGQPA